MHQQEFILVEQESPVMLNFVSCKKEQDFWQKKFLKVRRSVASQQLDGGKKKFFFHLFSAEKITG